MSGEKYYRIYNGISKNAWMVEASKLPELSGRTSHFISTGYYTKEQYEQFKKIKSVAGFETKTNQLWFDFDSDKLEESRRDAVYMYECLQSKFHRKAISVYFSANKGFHIIVQLNAELTSQQVKKIIQQLDVVGLETLDLKIYDSNRILRAENTKHEKTGLYKIQLSDDEFYKASIDDIKAAAKQPRENIGPAQPVDLPQDLLSEAPARIEKKQLTVVKDDPLRIKEIDFSQKPTGWRDYKWAIANGRFEIGKRNHAMMVIASTCRALKYGRDHTEAICLSADKQHCDITGDSPIEENALQREVLDVVFSEHWKGGQYSVDNDIELKRYCEKYGFDTTTPKVESKTIDIKDAFQIYKHFKKNAGKYIVETGIPSLDKAAKISIGTVVGIVAAPGVAKTSLGIQILNTMNNKGSRSLFFSYDMYISLVIQKLMQKHTTLTEEEIDKKIHNMSFDEEREVTEILEKEYGNVGICFESGQNVDEIITTLKAEREKHGEVNLIVIDYNELISSQNSDSTESSKEVAQKLRSLANTYNVCVIVLMQPNKISGGPSDEIKSYRSIKGSSMSEQSLDIALGLSRPGFDPEYPEDDKFLVVNCLKNRYGKLFRLELMFDGYTGNISDITSDKDRLLLQEVKQRKLDRIKDMQENSTGFGNFRNNNGY